jgi:hypothetical protein
VDVGAVDVGVVAAFFWRLRINKVASAARLPAPRAATGFLPAAKAPVTPARTGRAQGCVSRYCFNWLALAVGSVPLSD